MARLAVTVELAHAALARGYGDDVAHLSRCALTLGLRLRPRRRLLHHNGHIALEVGQRPLDHLLCLRAQTRRKGIVRLGKGELHKHLAPFGRYGLDDARRDDILLRLGVDHTRKYIPYLLFHKINWLCFVRLTDFIL